MEKLTLRIVHNAGKTGSPRLCNSCLHGLVLRGEGIEFAYCNYMREYVSVRVESCTRYANVAHADHDESTAELFAHYTLD